MNHTNEGPCRCRDCKPYTTRWQRIRAHAACVPWGNVADGAGLLVIFYVALLVYTYG